MLGESPVTEGAAASLPAGGSPSTDLAGPEPKAADATADPVWVAPQVSEHSRTASTQPAVAGSASSGPASIYRIHEGAGCVVCGGERPPVAVIHGDPFDKTKCARAWYGCPLDPATERPERRAA